MLRFNRRFDNLGDQFIFQATLEALARFGTVYVRGEFPGTHRNVRTSGNDWRLAWITAWSKLRGNSIYYVYPPGGRTWPNPVNTKSPRHWYRRAFDFLLGSRLSFGRSVIPTADHSWSKYLDWVGVRDQASVEALRDAGIQHVHYFPDLTFLAAPLSIDEAQRNGLCLSFRGTIPELRHDQAYQTQLSDAISALARSVSADDRQHARVFEQVEEDSAFSDYICRTTGIVHHQSLVTLETYESFYKPMRMVISNRLHCLLIGAYCGAIPVALTSSDHSKVVSLFQTVGWDSLLIPIENTDEIADRLRSIQGDISRLSEMVKKTFADQRLIGFSILQELFSTKMT